ncbi:MAG: bifunctional folylpolyglutamate synthase/dihydrofolate synthase [Clostridia bacterium]|nr:bifunctional folylpolyglutamate synthase/dihydrofolate synthase [Clostridia bacterium]
MNYEESLEYIHSISWTFCKPGLERISELCEKMGNPQNSLKFIHVAGTNGKGSFCSMLDSVLRKAGFRVGLYTSPYIRFFNERMCIDGKPISDEELADITSYVRPFADAMADKPTEFELITAIAFEYFGRHSCDVVILEAGMGGRLDSTNIINTPILSVITGIALDHVAFLGDTVEKIAAEKAGIIKKGIPVLYGGEDKSAQNVIRDTAAQRSSEFVFVNYENLHVKSATLDGSVFDFEEHKDMKIKLLGTYQPRNASVVLKCVDILRVLGYNISDKALGEGLYDAEWRGRFEIIDRSPLIIFDGAHNPQGICSAVESIKKYFGNQKIYVLTGVLKDKDYSYIAKTISEVAEKAFTITPDNPRALGGDEYAEVLKSNGVSAVAFESLKKAFYTAREEALAANVPLVCMGSLYIYSELIPLVEKDLTD